MFIPLFGGFLCFVQAITNPNIGFDWAKDINVWINYFLTTVFIYVLLDLFLKKIRFFNKHSTLFMVVSFFASAFVAQMLSYKVRYNLQPINFIAAVVGFVVGIIAFLLVVSVGLLMGRDKAEVEVAKMEMDYKEKLDNMSKHDRKKMRHFCEKALQLDDVTFKLISLYQDKNMIESVKNDLDQVIKSSNVKKIQ